MPFDASDPDWLDTIGFTEGSRAEIARIALNTCRTRPPGRGGLSLIVSREIAAR